MAAALKPVAVAAEVTEASGQVKNSTCNQSSYVMDAFKLLKRKLNLTYADPLKYEVKSNNVVLELSTAAFEIVRDALIKRFNDYPAGRNNTYHCDIHTKVDKQNAIESEVVKVYQGRRKTSVYQKDKQVFTMNLYRTTNKILVNGADIDTFLAVEMPLITELIQCKQGSIDAADVQLRKLCIESLASPKTGDSCPPSDGTVSSSTTGKAIENTPTLLDQSTTLVVANDLPIDNCEAGQTEVVETETVENVTQHELSDTVPKQVDDQTHVSTGEVATATGQLDQFHTFDVNMVDILNKLGTIASRVENLEDKVGNLSSLSSHAHESGDRLSKVNASKVKLLSDNISRLELRLKDKLKQQTLPMAGCNESRHTDGNNNESVSSLIDKTVGPMMTGLSSTLQHIPEAIDSLSSTVRSSSSKHTESMDQVVAALRRIREASEEQNKSLSFAISQMSSNMNNSTKECSDPSSNPHTRTQQQDSPQIKQDCTTDYYLVQGPKDPLSNFYPCKIEQESDNGRSIVFKSAEHCYQYNKVQFLLKSRRDPTISLQDIMQAKTAATAKWLGDKVNNHPDLHMWHQRELQVLHDILNLKLKCCHSFRRKLEDSGNALLYHSVSDKYWGIGIESNEVSHPLNTSSITGKNQHGKLLMEIRSKLVKETTTDATMLETQVETRMHDIDRRAPGAKHTQVRREPNAQPQTHTQHKPSVEKRIPQRNQRHEEPGAQTHGRISNHNKGRDISPRVDTHNKSGKQGDHMPPRRHDHDQRNHEKSQRVSWRMRGFLTLCWVMLAEGRQTVLWL